MVEKVIRFALVGISDARMDRTSQLSRHSLTQSCEQVGSLIRTVPSHNVQYPIASLLNSTGKSFLYRHAANVIVFPYGEWWAFRVIYCALS